MNACMYVYISMVLCSVSCFTLLFITIIVISHRLICDCVYSFFNFILLWTLLILGFILIMCVHLQLYSFCLFYFCLPFFSTCIRLCLNLQFPLSSLNFFLILLHAFWWWMLCLIVLYSDHLTPSSPYHPVLSFDCLLFLVGTLCYFPLYMLLWLL